MDNDKRIVTVWFDTPIKTGEEFTLRTGARCLAEPCAGVALLLLGSDPMRVLCCVFDPFPMYILMVLDAVSRSCC